MEWIIRGMSLGGFFQRNFTKGDLRVESTVDEFRQKDGESWTLEKGSPRRSREECPDR